jgi:UDP-glucose 4-epimerase
VIGIIGGTGFIGLNLSRHLQDSGSPCRTFSRNGLLLEPGNRYHSQLNKIEHVKGDLTDPHAVAEFVAGCHSIVLLVSHLLPSSSSQEINEVISWFGPAFVQLLESCRDAGIERIIFISSGGTVYGENETGKPVTELHPLNPHCAYGSFCVFLEQLIRTFHNQHGLPYTILRLANPYGLLKRTNKNQGLIDHYIRSARARRPFTVFGDGSEVRDYVYINDISKMIAKVAESSSQNSTFNIGTGVGHTSKAVIDLVRDRFDLPEVPLVFERRRLGDVHCSLLDMTKFAEAYGFRCDTTLEAGLTQYAEQELAEIC